MHIQESKLREFIADSGLVSKKEFKEAEDTADKKNISIGEVLVNDGEITKDDLRRMKAYVLGIPFVNLKDKKIDFETLSVIPEPIARKHNIVAYNKKENGLEVAMLDTGDLTAIDFIKKKSGVKVLPRLTDEESIKSVLRQYHKTLKGEFGDIIKKESQSIKQISKEENEVSESELKELAEDLPVVRIVDALLKHAIIQDASDIHIEPMEEKVLVRYRIDGILHDAMTLPKEASDGISARVKVLSDLKLDEKRLPQDGRFKVEMGGEEVSLRVSVLPIQYGEKVVMRLLRGNASGFTLEGLGFHGKALEDIHEAIRHSTGMILTTGPTGSGKTTTLYTVLDILNTPKVNISTIEDPVEYQMERINQTQVKSEIGFTFSSGLRSLIRQDPDIIMVGEIRDGETASLAVNAALTGHLVLSTLHTNSAAGAIPRLVEMGTEPFLLTSTLNIIIAQRLVRKPTDSKEKYNLKKQEIEDLSKYADLDVVLEKLKEEKIIDKKTKFEDIDFYKAVGISSNETGEDRDDGYSGRIGIYETLYVSPAIKELINSNVSSDKINIQARREGMMTMTEDGIFKAAQGLTTIEEVLRVITE